MVGGSWFDSALNQREVVLTVELGQLQQGVGNLIVLAWNELSVEIKPGEGLPQANVPTGELGLLLPVGSERHVIRDDGEADALEIVGHLHTAMEHGQEFLICRGVVKFGGVELGGNELNRTSVDPRVEKSLGRANLRNRELRRL